MIILEAVSGVHGGFEYTDDLIFPIGAQRVKAKGLVLLVEVLALKLAEIGKHGAVLHVMAVNDAVI